MDQPALPQGATLLALGADDSETELAGQALADAAETLARHGVTVARPAPGDGSRWVLADESAATTDAASARAVLRSVGGPVHVVVAVRPAHQMLPIAWERRVRHDRLQLSYREWLETVLVDSFPHGDAATRRRCEVVAAWAEAVGADNVTAVVTDAAEAAPVLRVLESLLALEPCDLRLRADGSERLSFAATEVLRRLNRVAAEREWSRTDYDRYVRRHVLPQLLRDQQSVAVPFPGATPEWVVQRLRETDRATAELVTASGVAVQGDLGVLDGEVPTQELADATMGTRAAADAVLAVVEAVGAAPPRRTAPRRRPEDVPRRALAAALFTHTVRRLRALVPSRARGAAPRQPPTPVRLEPGTCVLHIGPYKTGTTAVQNALSEARDRMRDHGVIYPGHERQHWFQALAVTGKSGLKGQATPPMRRWHRLVREVRAAGDRRVIVSSEVFSGADDDTARRIVTDLGGANVHVLVTLRPLTKILPSAWQTYVQNGLVTPYAAWLHGMLRRPPYDRPTPSFWRRHTHDVLVARWASIVGPENVSVVVLDESDRSLPFREIERMLGLPAGLLRAEQERSNRSMTLCEIELVRMVNRGFSRRAWPDELYRSYVRKGMIRHLHTSRIPPPDEPRIATPGWALERVAGIDAASATKLGGLGVRVVGDLRSLGVPPTGGVDKVPTTDIVPCDLVAEALGAVVAAAIAPSQDSPAEPAVDLDAFGTRRLASALLRDLRPGHAARRRRGRRPRSPAAGQS